MPNTHFLQVLCYQKDNVSCFELYSNLVYFSSAFSIMLLTISHVSLYFSKHSFFGLKRHAVFSFLDAIDILIHFWKLGA